MASSLGVARLDPARMLRLTAAIMSCSFAQDPQRWFDWSRLMTGNQAPAPPPYDWSLWQRLPFALAFVAVGAWRGWRWTVPVAAMFALPVFYIISLALLVGVLPFVRVTGARSALEAVNWLGRRRGGTDPTEPSPTSRPAPDSSQSTNRNGPRGVQQGAEGPLPDMHYRVREDQ